MDKKTGVELFREILKDEISQQDALLTKVGKKASRGTIGLRLHVMIGVAKGLSAAGAITESEAMQLSGDAMEAFHELGVKHFS